MKPWKGPEGMEPLTGDDGLQWLYTQALTMRNVAEVGVWKGGTTWTLLTACPGPVYAVDH